jgi:hypothetical protein
MPEQPHVRVSEVFVTADPRYTYSSRDASKLEDAVRDHLEERDKLLLITGPTKTGKTVLVDHVVPIEVDQWVKVEGPMVSTEVDVWQQIVDDLGYYTEEGFEASRTQTGTNTIGARAGVNVGVFDMGFEAGNEGMEGTTAGKSRSASRSPRTVPATPCSTPGPRW